jgi:hypothetical protein
MKAAKSSFLIVILFLVASMTVRAAQINGTIGFSGTVSLDTSSAGTATQVTGWHLAGSSGTPFVSLATGDFAPALGLSATFVAPWTFNMPGGPPILSFWSAGSFSFDLLTSVVTSQGFDTSGHGYIFVSGNGIFHGAGFDSTPGTWSFTTQDPSAGGVFSLSASGAAIPEPSIGVLITLGALLLAAGACTASRKRAAR